MSLLNIDFTFFVLGICELLMAITHKLIERARTNAALIMRAKVG